MTFLSNEQLVNIKDSWQRAYNEFIQSACSYGNNRPSYRLGIINHPLFPDQSFELALGAIFGPMELPR